MTGHASHAGTDRVAERRRAVALARHFREAKGLSIVEIAARLGRSPATIKAHFYDPTVDNKSTSTRIDAQPVRVRRSRSFANINTEMRSCRSLRSQHTVSLFECVRYIVYNVYVGRRGRQREHRAQERARAPRDRMARVQVNDETWAAYRAGLGTTPVGVALGRLVEREVASHGRRTALDADGVREAVHEARAVAGELENLIWRLEHTPADGPVHR